MGARDGAPGPPTAGVELEPCLWVNESCERLPENHGTWGGSGDPEFASGVGSGDGPLESPQLGCPLPPAPASPGGELTPGWPW